MDQDVHNFLHSLWKKDTVREIRAFDGRGYIKYGYFTCVDKAVKYVEQIITTHEVYVTLNPCSKALAARSWNRLKSCGRKDKTTSDRDIEKLEYILVDCDPQRPSGISATKEEKELAWEIAQRIQESLGKPQILGDSGNGYHLIYKHDADDATDIKRFLKFLDQKYSNESVKIDTAVFNPARITKVLGSWSRKGDNVPQRPHRKSHIIEIHKASQALQIPRYEKSHQVISKTHSEFDVKRFLQQNGVEIYEEKEWNNCQMFVLKECIFDASHKAKDASVIVQACGKVLYQCFHDSCKSRTWREARECIEGVRKYFCKFCSEQIVWENKKPFNLDGSAHNCQSEEEQFDFCIDRNKVPEFPVKVLPKVLKDYCIACASSIGCAVDFIATPLLVILGGVIGGCKKIEIKKNWRESCGLYSAIVGAPGSGKSPALNKVVSFLAPLEKRNQEINKEEELRYEVECLDYEDKLKEWRKKRKEFPDIEKPAPPDSFYYRRLHIADATVEAIAEILTNNKRGAVLVRDELTAWIHSQNQYKGGKGSDRQFFLSVWTNSSSPVDRKGKKPLYIDSPFLSVTGGLPTDELDIFKRNMGDGFLDRILFSYPNPIVRDTFSFDDEEDIDDKSIQKLFTRLYEDEEEKVYKLTPQAKKCFAQWYKQHQQSLCDVEEILLNPYSKMPGQLVRIALILCVIKRERNVGKATIFEAAQLVEYYKRHLRKVLGIIDESKDEEKIRKVIEYAKKRNKSEISTRDICRSRFMKITKAKEARELLIFCAQNGIGTLEKNVLLFDKSIFSKVLL